MMLIMIRGLKITRLNDRASIVESRTNDFASPRKFDLQSGRICQRKRARGPSSTRYAKKADIFSFLQLLQNDLSNDLYLTFMEGDLCNIARRRLGHFRLPVEFPMEYSALNFVFINIRLLGLPRGIISSDSTAELCRFWPCPWWWKFYQFRRNLYVNSPRAGRPIDIASTRFQAIDDEKVEKIIILI